ncbi:hypothetical protein GWK47_053099 [Chionoecetes opilio]|uniref:Uncharacterized protein n=1 Tax=Chionoecetes opilio TaxID=41210 RepID=A0A8J4YB45_CHIOP|nr:hypothetical protein GWK47_053099 [Chionoecetes opilio]
MFQTARQNYPAFGEGTRQNGGPSMLPNTPQGPFIIASGIGSLSRDIFRNLGDMSNKKQPPKLPPKGVPLPESEESEYHVPQGTDGEYHVPSANPIPTEATNVVNKISGPIPTPSSILQVSVTPTILPIKTNERRASMSEDKKPAVSSFRADTDTKPARNTAGSSVRDMIAKLNQRKPSEDTDTLEEKPQEEEEEEEKPVPSAASIPLPKQHLRPDLPDKPPLPNRPPNLRNPSPLPPLPQPQGRVENKEEPPPPQQQQQQEEVFEEDDEVYDVIDEVRLEELANTEQDVELQA